MSATPTLRCTSRRPAKDRFRRSCRTASRTCASSASSRAPTPAPGRPSPRCCGRMLAEGRLSAPEPSDHPAQVLAAYLLLALRHEVLGQDVLELEARKAAETLRQVFPAAFIARLRTLMDEVPGLTSTADTVDLARRIRRLIEEEAKHPPKDGAGRTDGSDEQNPAGEDSGTDGEPGDGASSEEGSCRPTGNGWSGPWSEWRRSAGIGVGSAGCRRRDGLAGRHRFGRRYRAGFHQGCRRLRSSAMPLPRFSQRVRATAPATCSPRSGSCSARRPARPPRSGCRCPRIMSATRWPGCACWPGSRRNRRG